MCGVKIMIRGVGIDSVEVERMKKIVEKGDRSEERRAGKECGS